MATRASDSNTPTDSISPAGVAVTPPLRVAAAPIFEGSLATLFHLARDGRIDLTGIPLAPVCHAYIDYLSHIGLEDVDTAGAALLALAYLVERKAWALLPIADPPPPQEIPELPEPTAHEFAQAVDDLEVRHSERGRLFFRAVGPEQTIEPPLDLSTLTTRHLARTLERLLERAAPIDVKPIAAPRPSLAEVMTTCMKRLAEAGGSGGFADLLEEGYTRLDVVFVFLAVLELVRVGQLTITIQEDEVCLRLKAKS
jgi:segregation and condensation protein A